MSEAPRCPACGKDADPSALRLYGRCFACEGAWRKEHPEVNVEPDPSKAELLAWLMRHRGAAMG